MWMPVEASIEIGYVDDFEALLKAIAAAFPSDAVLYVEGAAFAPEVAGYLREHDAAERPPIKPNTLWPKPKTFHLPMTPINIDGLQELASRHASPEVADHLVVYHGEEVLLWAHDAGYGYVQLARSLPPAVVDTFRSALGGALR